ncbi:MAG: carboxypeptidase regulatory-like domain-containing protein [Spirochaetales bacterium]|nr:carboxypeptidase regulatory-like domain-containing protein [Spirochaetales bacterium]
MKRFLKVLAVGLMSLLLLTSCDLLLALLGGGKGTVAGAVRDAVTNTSIQGVSVKIYSSTNVLLGSGTTDANGNYTITDVKAGNGHKAVFEKTGYMTANYYGISVTANETTYLESLLQISNAYNGTGTANGTITNAFNGQPVEGATLKFREGINQTAGTVLYTTTTGSSGNYTVTTTNLGAGGYYSAEVSKSGFITTVFTVILVPGNTINNQNTAISPVNMGDIYRFVLTWGASPTDLDSHLTGPTDGLDRFHVYYSDQQYPASGDDPEVALDVDDTTSYGPETITIYTKRSGEYRYYVHDYSNRYASADSPSTQLANSGAQVKVYKGANLITTYNVPTNSGGNCWDVFKLSGNTLTPVNALSYINDWHTGRAERDEHQLFMNLPAK